MTLPNLPEPPDSAAPVLSPAWVSVLAQGLAAPHTELSTQAAQSIKSRLMQRVAAQTLPAASADGQVHNIMRDEAWVSLSKKIQVKVLHDDGTTLSWLLKLLPGGRLPQHDHADGLEECLVLEGQLSINGAPFGGGDYQIAHPGSVHYEVASELGALVFLKSPSSRRKDLAPA